MTDDYNYQLYINFPKIREIINCKFDNIPISEDLRDFENQAIEIISRISSAGEDAAMNETEVLIYEHFLNRKCGLR